MNAPKRSLFSRPNPTQTAGVVLAGLGLLLFVSVLATAVANLSATNELRVHFDSILVRIFGGLFLIVLGFVILAVRAHRISSANVDISAVDFSLDDEDRQLDGVKTKPARIGRRKKRDEEKVCRFCDSKNETNARFCNQCGVAL